MPLMWHSLHTHTHTHTQTHTHTHIHTRIEKTKLPILKVKMQKIENSYSLHLWETLLFQNTWDMPFITKLSPKINQFYTQLKLFSKNLTSKSIIQTSYMNWIWSQLNFTNFSSYFVLFYLILQIKILWKQQKILQEQVNLK